MIIPHLRTQDELKLDIRTRMRDGSAARWTNAEIYAAINDCLLSWDGRVSVPHLYEVPGGWIAGQTDYSLPAYIRGPIDPLQKTYSSQWLHLSGVTSDANTWVGMQAFDVFPDGAGGQVLRLQFSPMADEGQIVWWMANGPIPTTLPTLADDVAIDATSLEIADADLMIADAGYIRISYEWMHYSGVTRTDTGTTLNNLIRGLNSQAAEAHAAAGTIQWGIGVHRQDLWGQMMDHVVSFLHGLYLTNAAEQERTSHERLSVYYAQKAQEFWRRYTPARSPQIRLGRGAVGPVQQETPYYYRTWGKRL